MYKAAKFNDQAKFGLIREAIKSDQGMLQFVFLRKEDIYEKVRETRLEYADNQKLFAIQGEQITDYTRSGYQEGEKEKLHKDTSEKVDITCKKVEKLALLISKDKPKKNIQYITCHKCKTSGHYASRCQLIGSTTQGCVYCGRYGHTEATCCKKQAEKARLKAEKDKTRDILPKMILNKEVDPKRRRKRCQLCLCKRQRSRRTKKKC